MKTSRKSGYEVIEVVEFNDYYPASSQQRRLYALQRLEEESTAYNMPHMMVIEGDLDRIRMKEAFKAVVQRHDSLRTSFEMVNGEPVQRIHPKTPLPLQFEQGSEVEVLHKADKFVRPFDLEEAPLWRVQVVQTGPLQHVLMIDMHHIISDRVSVSLLVREFQTLYEGKDLPELRIQYKDFVAWQQKRMDSDEMKEQEKYWMKVYKEEIPALNLPTDHPKPSRMGYEGKSLRFKLEPELTEALYRFSAEQGVTLYMTLLAVYNVLLYKYTGQEDIVVGSPMAGRKNLDLENVIGTFANTLGIRNHPQGDKKFTEFLIEVKERTLQAYENQDYPLEQLVDRLGIQWDLSRHSLFNTVFVLQNIQDEVGMGSNLEVGGLRFTEWEREQTRVKFDWEVTVLKDRDQLRVQWDYSTQLFNCDTMNRLKKQFIHLLWNISKNPKQKLKSIEVISENEKEQLAEFNQTKVPYPKEKTVHRLFEEMANRYPDRVAAVAENGEVTYQELNGRANRIARGLREAGLQTGEVVGIVAERSLEMMAGILAVLKAGGAYLPIDPKAPESRVSYMLENSGARLALTQQRFVQKVSVVERVLELEEERWTSGDDSDLDVNGVDDPGNLAYVIYTSGSTGKPKGVMVEHRSVINRVNWMVRQYEIDETDVLLQKTPYVFDVSVWELFLWFFVGGRICFLAAEEEKNPEAVVRAVERYGVTLIHFVPSMFTMFLNEVRQHGRLEQLVSLRRVFTSGEALHAEQVEQHNATLGRANGTRLHNLYGPTEATVDVTYYDCPVTESPRTVPIGRPIDNIRLYIVGDDGHLQPIGVPGELCIAGVGLARGYINNPALTAEKFVPNPFESRGRMYRTGDRARWLADGNIEFLGRLDYQVKIRGYRIELGEVESALLEHEGVQESVVTGWKRPDGEPYLCAYIVGRKGLTTPELRKHLSEILPEYMIPARFMFLKFLPLNTNGKVDRKALPEPVGYKPSENYVPPTHPVDAKLAGIWAEVLGVEQVGIYDNFLDLGGHSLLGVQVTTKARQHFGIHIPIQWIFDYPVLRDWAKEIKKQQSVGKAVKRPSLQSLARRNQSIPLSFSQQGLWFIEQLEPGSPLYNVPRLYRLAGELNRDAAEKSFFALANRHEILRVTFQEKEGMPAQIVNSSLPAVTFHEMSEQEAKRQIDIEARVPFDLEKGPLLRVDFFSLDSKNHLMLINMHHLICDLWSMGILIKEWLSFYQAYQTGQSAAMESLPVQFTDYACLEKDLLTSGEMERQLDFWKNKLGGELPTLTLFPNQSHRVSRSSHGKEERFRIPSDVVDKLQGIGGRQNATLYMTVMAAFQALLHRYSQQNDIVVGTPVAGRMDAEKENLIGCFVNTVVVRTDLSGEPTFNTLLDRVKSEFLQAFNHQDVPFEKVVRALRPDRDQSHSPLFQVMLSFQSRPYSPKGIPELEIKGDKYIHTGTSKFDLTLYIELEEDGWIGYWEYRTDRFEEDAVKRMSNHFLNLLKAIADDPDQPINRMDMLTDTEKRQLLDEWNDTDVSYPSDKCLHELFQKQADLTPDAVAAIYKNKEITYGQLEQESNRLAHFLRERGIREDTCVGVYMDRSLELVTALLGILKAGGAFLPLDTEAPKSRVMKILQDAKAPLCLTQEHLAKGLDIESSVVFVSLDKEKDELKKYPVSRVQSQVSPDHLVSVYYTSGSTGQPKGVASTHRGWVNRMHWMQRQHQLQPGESVLQKTTLTFDDAAVEFFWPLMVGGRIALIEPGMHRDPRAILDAGVDYKVSVIQFVPSMLGMVIDTITEEDKQSLNCLRVVISSGEALHGDLVKRFLQHMPGKLFNTWGATEVSIDSTMHACSEKDVQDAVVSVGRPIDNNQVYILDRNLQPVPLGVAGDLYIGGIGVARGYLNQPERTKHAFMDHPFRPGLRLYRTGDRGCFKKDGAIVFLGREDNQVKIRGMRVETGEIENTLLEHEAVKEAVVILREDQSVKRLVAYLVSTDNTLLDTGELRMYLQNKLPEYMIPAYYIVLDRIPLNANGKVERSALPAPDSSHLALQEDFVEARTDTEKTLAKIWSELLGLDRVGVHDHFFKLGGHSLLAVQVISRIFDETRARIPLRFIFEKPTIEDLAVCIDQKKGRDDDQKGIEPTNQTTHLPLSFAQQRLWFLHQLNPESSVYNMPKCYIVRGTLDLEAIQKSLKQLIERHPTLRTVFESNGEGYPVQSVLTQWELPFEYKDLSHLPSEENEELVQEIFRREARRPFHLSEGPLFRVQLIRCHEQEHRLIFNMHHIISDGWSIGIMIREISEIYTKICAGVTVELQPLPVQYADYALWQKELLTDESLKEPLAYWKRQLGGEIPSLQLPMDTSSESRNQGNNRITYRLSEDLVKRLKDIGHKEEATLFMTLLAAFKVLLHRMTDQDDILIGTPIVNRNRKELEYLIGLFLNTLVLRTDLSGNPSFMEQLRRVRQTSMDAYSYQEAPFERVVEEVQPERSLNRNPLFDVMINYITKEEVDDHLWNIPGADVEEQDFLEFESKFLMTLYIFEKEQGLQLDLVYRSDKFSDIRMKEILNQYHSLLNQIVQDPQREIHSYSLLTQEAEQMLPDPEAPIKEVDLKPVTKMFERQVASSPKHVAIIRGKDRWTYSQLKKYSDHLAWKLHKEGVQKGQIVAVTGGKSFKLIAGILAVWKIGGVFLPIDENLPLKRKKQLLTEAGADVLLDLSENGLPDDETPAIQVFCPEENESDNLYSPDFEGLSDHPQLEDPAYIYFTSGTTGRPKGILGKHKGLSHFLDWQKKEFQIQPNDRFAQLTHISFDAFLRDVFLPLVCGASVCLPEEPVNYEADHILPWLQQENISVLHLVPSLIQSWLTDRVRPTSLPSLRYVFFSGEALTSSLIQRWRSKFSSNIQLINLYGPTETTMVKCFSRVPPIPLAGAQPLQHPMPQTQVLILNRKDSLCGIGEVGEVVIRTPYRTKGYINDPQKNEDSFIRNPFTGLEEDLLYRTGDLGRYRPDGSLEILGRRDHQVKIRGVRLDLNEVVSTLHQHPKVAFCAVKLWENDGEPFLAAYVIPAEDHFDETALRSYLGNLLPAAMIPSVFLCLDHMPVTASGKVDYRRLPEPKRKISHTREHKTFSTPEEKMLSEIWSDVLRKENISVDDNFFELGGHSLMALQIISRIKNIFGIHLPLKCIFEAPTISGLAAMIQEREENPKPSPPESEIKALRREQYQKSILVKK
ncbi:non-ribosomal peptide synthetase [Desmospora activa]|uniref:Amino acid adenylation domain-containing protein n=1 Tax=Desmospora activa DSM 45169 TaxID=1121389 RepID=A0A2T4ZAA4_9BACL|nr:non-ribosomal peptide synthetase [Desmospora activa]PTM58821.1 amino acid adenylation domain-containing protein [Desmospora activa DSM 45169]